MTAIIIEALTNENTSGVFDVLSAVMRKQLQEEFSAGRISATEYSKVYVTNFEATLNQAINFLLQKDIAAAQADLIAAQRNLAVTQELAVQKEILLTIANTEKVNREVLLLDKQEDLLDAQISLTNEQVVKLGYESDILLKEKDKLIQEILLVIAKTAETNKQIEILTAQALNIPKDGVLLDKQALKIQAEVDFTAQRTKTEKAQIIDIIDGVVVSGIVGKQSELYAGQLAGLTRKAEFDLVDAMIRVWGVQAAADPEGVSANNINLLNDKNLGKAIAKYMAGIGVIPDNS